MAVKTPLCRWACRVRTVREKPDFQTRRRAIFSSTVSLAHGEHTPRASPSLRDPYATGSGRAAARQSSSSRIARAESSRRFRSGSVRLFVCHAKGLSTSDIARHVSVHGAAVRRRAGSRPARRGSGRGTRAPTALPYLSRDPEAEVRAEAAAIPAPPEDSTRPRSRTTPSGRSTNSAF